MTEEMKKYLKEQQSAAEMHAHQARQFARTHQEITDKHLAEAAKGYAMAAEFKELLEPKEIGTLTVKLDLDTTEEMDSIQTMADNVAQIAKQFNAVSAGGNALLTERV